VCVWEGIKGVKKESEFSKKRKKKSPRVAWPPSMHRATDDFSSHNETAGAPPACSVLRTLPVALLGMIVRQELLVSFVIFRELDIISVPFSVFDLFRCTIQITILKKQFLHFPTLLHF
jgi:hypothetical protein